MLRSNRSRPSPRRGREARALVGVITAGSLAGVTILLLASTAGWLAPRAADAEASASASAPAAKAPVKPASPAAAAKPAEAPAAKAVKKPAAKTGAAAPGAVVQSEHLDDQVAYQYNALGRRDPFQALMGGEYVGADVGGQAPPDVGGLKVVGIVWGDADQFALVEDARGDSHILRRGDKVMNGYVETLKRDAMIVNLTLDGQSQSVRVPLTRKGDKSNANR